MVLGLRGEVEGRDEEESFEDEEGRLDGIEEGF